MSEFDRGGRAAGAGFYDYEGGKRAGLWPGLVENFGGTNEIPFRDMQERMLFAEALESVKCVDEGVLRSTAEANIGSIFGIGFPPWTGGVLQYINGYEGGPQDSWRGRTSLPLPTATGSRLRGHLLIWQPLVVASNKDLPHSH